MQTIVELIWVISAMLLIALVLLHSPKGDGIGAIGGQAQLFSSSKTAEQTLNRVTWLVATLFLLFSLVLGAGWLTVENSDPIGSPAPLSQEES